MARKNRGKAFEQRIKEACLSMPDVSVDRIPDQMGHYKGARNICDFIVYRYPTEYYLECKSVYDTSFPLSNITDDQLKGLVRKSNIPGVIAGIVVWFIDLDLTYFIPITYIRILKEADIKSINPKKDYWNELGTDLWKFPVSGKKDRVYYKYNLEPLFNQLKEYYLL